MRTLNAIDHIRAHPELYLPEGRPDSAGLARRLAGDAFFLGASFAGIVTANGWWFVVADKDWLGVSGDKTADAFSRIIPFPEAGPNAVRTEALLAAFAKDVVAFDYDRAQTIKGLNADDAAAAAIKAFHGAIYPQVQAKRPPDWLTRPKLVIAFRVADGDQGQH